MPTFPTKTIEVEEGAANVSVYLNVYTTAGIASTGLISIDVATARFVRDRQATVSIATSDLGAITSAHLDGGLKEISSAQFPGLYRFDLPDAVFAALDRQNNKVRIKLTFSDGSSSESELLEIVLIKPEDDIWNALGASHLVAASMGEKMAALAPIQTFVEASPAPSATSFAIDDITMSDDTLIDAILVFIDGDLIGQARRITGNTVSGTSVLTFGEPWIFEGSDGPPASGDRCVVIQGSPARGVADAVWLEDIASHLTGSSLTAAAHLFALTPGSFMTPAAGGTPTSTAFDSDATEANDFWNGQYLTFTEGNLAGQSRRITDFVNTNGRFTVSPAFAAAPGTDSEFVICSTEDPLGFPLAELLAGAPSATPEVQDAIMLLYMMARNKIISSPTEQKIHNDAGAVIAKATQSFTTEFTRGELGEP